MDEYDQSGNGFLDVTNKGDNYNLLVLLSAIDLWCGSYKAKKNNESAFTFMDCLNNHSFQVGVANIPQAQEDADTLNRIGYILVNEQPRTIRITDQEFYPLFVAVKLFVNTMSGIFEDFESSQEYQVINKTLDDLNKAF